jgi:hypothetical protein
LPGFQQGDDRPRLRRLDLPRVFTGARCRRDSSQQALRFFGHHEHDRIAQTAFVPATGELSGRVVDEQGRPVSDAIVSVHDLGRIVTYTDALGRLRLQKVAKKEIWLRAQAESGEWAQKITPDARDLNLKLETR